MNEKDVDRRALFTLAGGIAAAAVAESTGWSAMASAQSKPSDIVSMSGLDLSAAIKTKRVSCVEVMNAYLDRLKPRIDDVLQRARQTTDPMRRKDLYELFAGYLIAATPSIPLYAPVYTYAQSERVHGFSDSLLFTPASRFASVDSWYIETRVQ